MNDDRDHWEQKAREDMESQMEEAERLQRAFSELTPIEQFEVMLKDPKFKAEYESEIAKLAQGGI